MLDKVIRGLECCTDGDCPSCPYFGEAACDVARNREVLELLREYRELLRNGDMISRSGLIKKIFPYGMPDDGNYGINARAVMKAITEI